jgi:hypothetical protein
LFTVPGCAIHYFNPENQTEHIWGIGHMKMKVAAPREETKATVKGVEIYGIGLGLGRQEYYTVFGWDRRTLLSVLDNNTSVRLEWPSNDFFDVRVGSLPPFVNHEVVNEQ